jgi:DNA polymerase III subunit delta'
MGEFPFRNGQKTDFFSSFIMEISPSRKVILLSFDRLKHQAGAVRLLKTALAKGRIAHAYCFHGPEGSGKRAAALELAKAVNCENGSLDACDRCSSCRRIEHGNHPDIVTVRPEGTLIKIDQVRALQQQFRYGAPPGVTRVVIMEEADKMRAEAANSLLKFLEEPVSPMIAILITENPDSILPTILSRCQKVRFQEPPPQVRAAQLESEGIPADHARVLAHLHMEAICRYKDNLDLFQNLVSRVIEWSREILSGQATALIAAQDEWPRGEDEEDLLPLAVDLYLLWIRDLVHLRLNGHEPAFQGWEKEMEKQAWLLPPEKLLIAMDNALIAARLLRKSHLQPQAVLEQMVLATQAGTVSTDPGV